MVYTKNIPIGATFQLKTEFGKIKNYTKKGGKK